MPHNDRDISSSPITQTKTPFIGRSAVLERLFRLLTTTDDYHLQTVFITGEAGIGKTRLAQEFVNMTGEHGWQVWKGHADAISRKISFSTLLQVFRAAVNQLSSSERFSLSEEVPNISRLIPGFDQNKLQTNDDVRWDRIELFETFRSIAVQLTHNKPTVIWIDDFPDADAETMEWLHYFVRREERASILFLATCRTPIAEEAAEYRDLHLTLTRHCQFEEIELQPFERNETASLAKGLVFGDVHESVLRLVQDRTRGIPLFTVELIRMLLANGDFVVQEGKWDLKGGTQQQVPSAITSVVSQRITHLSDLQKEVLDFIAISDAPLPWTILEKATGAASHSLATSLSRLVQLAILDDDPSSPDMEYSFSHPMIHEVVMGNIDTTTSRHLHRILATSWRENPVRAAYHIRWSGSMTDIKEAVTLLADAGRHYLSVRAHQTAREYLEMAVALAEASPGSITLDLEQNVRILLCEAWAYSERVAEALRMLDELGRHVSSVVTKIQIERLMASIESTRFVENCIRHIEDGLALWDGQSENEDVFWMLNEQVFNYLNSDAIAQAKRILLRLRDYCELHPSPKCSLVLGIREAHIQVFDWRRGPHRASDAGDLIERARTLADPEWLYDAYGLLGYSSLNHGDHVTAVRYWKECMPLVHRYGMATYEYALTIMGACGLFLAGDWERALTELDVVERMAREYSIHLALAAVLDLKAVIYALRGRWSRAGSCTMEVKELITRSFSTRPSVHEVYRIHAVTALQMIVQGVGASVPDSASVVWANVHGLPLFLKLLEGMIQIRSGNAHVAEKLIADLQEAAEGTNYAKGVANLLAGLLSNHRGEPLEAMALIEDAMQTFDLLEIPLEGAIARLEWGATAALQQPEDAEKYVKVALSTFRQLEAKPFSDRAKSVLQMIQAQRNAVLSDISAASLSEREREIISYISKGLSNKDIAKTLVLSRRTVDAHLNKIYKKLDVHSRTALLHKLNL